jgi:NhaA family Na+:H+ antiporter
MRREFARIQASQSVGEALDWLRRHPPEERVLYFYVLDEEARLQGVVPTRRLVLSPPDTPVVDIMVRKVIGLPAGATVAEACEFFIQHRLLAFPVVDEQGHVLGVVDVDLYTSVLSQFDQFTPIRRLVAPFARFMEVESSGGLVLLACTLAALALANSPLAADFQAVWQAPLGIAAGEIALSKPLLLWINDGLMTLFFFVVGLEIKRELIGGELADPRKAVLPVVAALGGMIVPAAIYAVCLLGRPGAHGWGVPMATDIAFVVGFLTLLGRRVPNGLKVLLLTLAIADDIGSILVIAFAYSTDIHVAVLVLAILGFILLVLLLRLGVRSRIVYGTLAAAIWLGFLKSGVHPTVAGVIWGLLTPARPFVRRRVPFDVVSDLVSRIRGVLPGDAPPPAVEVESPLERLENVLHPWVAFVVMPVFALANAGVQFGSWSLVTPVSLAVVAGLVLGKPIGIVLFSWASVRIGMGRLPGGVNWKAMIGAGCLGGIGFTMSLFVAGLGLEGTLLADAKTGILAGSAISALLGCVLLLAFLPSVAAERRE